MRSSESHTRATVGLGAAHASTWPVAVHEASGVPSQSYALMFSCTSDVPSASFVCCNRASKMFQMFKNNVPNFHVDVAKQILMLQCCTCFTCMLQVCFSDFAFSC
jgi:hypothetical protein